MTNPIKLALAAFLLSSVVFADAAHAIAINKCIRLLRDPQVGRETVVNVCQVCMTAKVKRARPGSASGTPSMREFNLQPGTRLTLPFRGPGQTRLSSELPCPSAR